jgi:hypothetical protein
MIFPVDIIDGEMCWYHFLDEPLRWVKFIEVVDSAGAFPVTAFVDSELLLSLPFIESITAVRAIKFRVFLILL